jgi:rhodanese-related sulfurtransferase
MIFNKSIRTVVLALVLGIFLWLGVGPSSVLAAPLPATESILPEMAETLPEASLALETAVDRFLTAMPNGYYAIANVASLKSRLATSEAVLVDVREPSEYQSGHIPNAINIPLRTLTDNLDKIGRDRPVVLYCSTGYRSAMGVMTLHLLGYDNVQGFPPSFAGWKTAGEMIVK